MNIVHCTPETLPPPAFDAHGYTVDSIYYHIEHDSPWIVVSRGRWNDSRNIGFSTTLDIETTHTERAETWISEDPAVRNRRTDARVVVVWYPAGESEA